MVLISRRTWSRIIFITPKHKIISSKFKALVRAFFHKNPESLIVRLKRMVTTLNHHDHNSFKSPLITVDVRVAVERRSELWETRLKGIVTSDLGDTNIVVRPADFAGHVRVEDFTHFPGGARSVVPGPLCPGTRVPDRGTSAGVVVSADRTTTGDHSGYQQSQSQEEK